MTVVTLAKGVEQHHPTVVSLARAGFDLLPSDGSVVLCDSKAPIPARRQNERAVLLNKAAESRIERLGEARLSLSYAPGTEDIAVAAILAAGAAPGTPVCADPSSLAVLTMARRVATSDVPVLIEGPTGTGKEVLARFIHNASPRRDQPFIAINCAAMPETMLEAMLFGHVKGAYTGASSGGEGFFRAADGGTLLLDEIAEMPIGLQAKLLRALQEREVVPVGATRPVPVDVRIIACANRDLPVEVAEGRLRADLYYRLCVFPISLGPLCQRPVDIAPLAFAMLLRHSPPVGRVTSINGAALARLMAHDWPGNVRELENVIRRAMVLAEGEDTIGANHILFDSMREVPATSSATIIPIRPAVAAASTTTPSTAPRSLAQTVRSSEAEAILDALNQCDGHRGDTASVLGISERTLRYRLAEMRDAGIACDNGKIAGARA